MNLADFHLRVRDVCQPNPYFGKTHGTVGRQLVEISDFGHNLIRNVNTVRSFASFGTYFDESTLNDTPALAGTVK